MTRASIEKPAEKVMRHRLISAWMFLLVFWHAQVIAVNDEQLAAISELGSLNGVALHCQGLAQTQKIKRGLVVNLPKRRQLGELFEYETNKSFMAFIEKNGVCPSPQTLAQQVEKALLRLEVAFSSP
jgi:hypothetical protein